VLEGLGKFKKEIHLIESRTHDLPAGSIVPPVPVERTRLRWSPLGRNIGIKSELNRKRRFQVVRWIPANAVSARAPSRITETRQAVASTR
jgi:hypothetical protein